MTPARRAGQNRRVTLVGLLPQVLFACAAMAAFLWWVSGDWQAWNGLGAADKAWRMALAVAGGAAVYFAALGLAGLRPRHLKSL